MRLTPGFGIFNKVYVILAVSALLGCGIVPLGEGVINDPVPSGTIVAQGNLSGQSGRSAAGVVAIYEQTASGSTCSFVLRLQNLSAPSDVSLRVVPVVNGAPNVSPTFYTLRAATGNQNYAFSGAACGATWAQVSLNDPTAVPGAQTYATATLQSP